MPLARRRRLRTRGGRPAARRAPHAAGPRAQPPLVAAAALAREIGGVEVADRLLEAAVPAQLDALGRARLLALRPRASAATLAAAARAARTPTSPCACGGAPRRSSRPAGGDGAGSRARPWRVGAPRRPSRSAPTGVPRTRRRPSARFLGASAGSRALGVTDPVALALRGYLALVSGDVHGAAALLDRAAHELRAQRRRTPLGQVLALSRLGAARVSDLDRAQADGEEAAALCGQVRQPLWGALAQTALATVAALRGDEERGRAPRRRGRAGRAAAPARRLRARARPAGARRARAGRRAARPRRSRTCAGRSTRPTRRTTGAGRPAARRPGRGGDDREERAFVRAACSARARARDAACAVSASRARARRRLPPRVAPGARARGLVLADDADADAAFARAAARIGEDWPFARARMLLVHGMRLRRQRRMADSRAPLRDGRGRLRGARRDAVGRARAARARGHGRDRASLATTSSSGSRRGSSRSRGMAARGMTNRAIAADLALSPRTVGHHLARIFPKLDVSSRAGVGAALERHGY